MLNSLFHKHLLPKMGRVGGAVGNSQIVIVLLFIIVVVAAICWLYLQKKAETHSYRCGGAEIEDVAYEGGEYGDDAFEGGAEDAEVTGGADGARLGIRDEWFKKMLLGDKMVEGRLRRGAAATLKKGDLITIARSRPLGDTKEYGKPYRYVTKVTRVTTYKSFADLIKGEGVEKLFPGKKKDSDALDIYRQHSTEADEAEVVNMHDDKHGVVAIEVAPYDEKMQAEYRNMPRTPHTPRTRRGAAARRNFY